MDPRTRDYYLARWLIARNIANQQQIAYLAKLGGDFPSVLISNGVLNQAGLDQFYNELRSHSKQFTPPSNPSAFRKRFAATTASLPKVGEQFGEYNLLAELGRGGMGAVFKVKDSAGDIYALKVMLAGEDADERERERFKREVEVLKSLDHPNIVNIYDSGQAGQLDYYVMDFLAGAHGVTRFVDENNLSIWQAVNLVIKYAEALGHAHERGIIHRDVKPGNMIVDEGGRPWVVDFGLARDVDRATRLTQEGSYLGTPAYMAPEQCVASSDVDGRADIYALGVILYELLTGKKPFSSDSVTTLMAAILNQPPEIPSSISVHIDKNLEAVCLKALEKKPENRYQTAQDFANELNKARAGQSVDVVSQRRNKKLSLIVFGSILFSLLIGGGSFIYLNRDTTKVYTHKELRSRAKKLNKIISKSERKLMTSADIQIQELERSAKLPGHYRLEKDAYPIEYSEILGRIEILKGELAYRIGNVESANNHLEQARKQYLTQSSQATLYKALQLKVEATTASKDTAPKLITALDQAILANAERYDLIATRAGLLLKTGATRRALKDYKEVSHTPFADWRKHLDCLIELEQFDEADKLKKLRPDLTPAPQDVAILLWHAKLQLEKFNFEDVRKSLTLAIELAEKQQSENAKNQVRSFVWNWFRTFEDLKSEFVVKTDISDGIRLLVRFQLERLKPLRIPDSELPMTVSNTGLRVRQLKGEVAIHNATAMVEAACLWQPNKSEHWTRYVDESFLKSYSKPIVWQTIIKNTNAILKSANEKDDFWKLTTQLYHVYRNRGSVKDALRVLPQPTQKDFEMASYWPRLAGYEKALCLYHLKRIDEALDILKRIGDIGSPEQRSVLGLTARILKSRGQLKEALEYELRSAELMRGKSSLSKWGAYSTSILVWCVDYPDQIERFRKIANKDMVRIEVRQIIKIWEALMNQSEKELDAVLDEVSKNAISKPFRKRVATLKSRVKFPMGKDDIKATLKYVCQSMSL